MSRRPSYVAGSSPIFLLAPSTLRHCALHRSKLHPSVMFAALVLLQRLRVQFLTACGSFGHHLFTSAFMLTSKVICDDTYIVVLANVLHRSKLHPLATFAALVLLCTATEGVIPGRSWIIRLPSLYIGLHARVQGHLRRHLHCCPR